MNFRAFYELGPKYMPNGNLPFANKELLLVPEYFKEKRTFSVVAPILWNNLPDHIRSTIWLGNIKSRMNILLQEIFATGKFREICKNYGLRVNLRFCARHNLKFNFLCNEIKRLI